MRRRQSWPQPSEWKRGSERADRALTKRIKETLALVDVNVAIMSSS